MRRENKFRIMAVEAAISQSPDGLLHGRTAAAEPCKETPRSGPESSYGVEYAAICLSCPLKRCQLEDHKICRRFHREVRQMKGERQNGTKHDEGGD